MLQQQITECLQQLQRYMVGVVLGDGLGKWTMVFYRIPSALDRVLTPDFGTQGRYRRRMVIQQFFWQISADAVLRQRQASGPP